ncbi:MAG: T9SS type A sorting domain-containing protein [Ignavibacteriaceae bacterium]|nr:T9SS type A sorting domain-containing protein [Ignavibacteriaceae bacterium]
MSGSTVTGKKYITIVLLIAASSFMFYASSAGITGATRKNGNGCTCHGAQSSAVQVTINGPASLAAGQTRDYSVVISGGPLNRGGTNISVSAGTLALITGEGTRLANGEITHTSPKTPVSGSVTFNFKFTAPEVSGPITMFANGNSVNLNGNNSGDQWNFAPDKTIDVVTSVEDELRPQIFDLGQNFPNPFNPSTVIPFLIKQAGEIRLGLYDITGREIAVLTEGFHEARDYSIRLNSADYGLTSGVYFYKLQAEGQSAVKKLVLNK